MVLKYLVFIIAIIGILMYTQNSFSIEPNGSKLLKTGDISKVEDNTTGIERSFGDIETPKALSSSTKGLGLFSINPPPTNNLLTIDQIDPLQSNLVGGNGIIVGPSDPTKITSHSITKSPFKSCIVDPSSLALSTSASYRIHGEGKIDNPSENGNYTINKWLSVSLIMDAFNQISGGFSVGDLYATIKFNPIITECFNSKNFQDSQLSSLTAKITPYASQINPPFNSCPSGFDIRYAIAGNVIIPKEQTITINDPNNLYFGIDIYSDFRTGELRGNVQFPGIYESFNLDSISTTCTTGA